MTNCFRIGNNFPTVFVYVIDGSAITFPHECWREIPPLPLPLQGALIRDPANSNVQQGALRFFVSWRVDGHGFAERFLDKLGMTNKADNGLRTGPRPTIALITPA